MENFDVIKSLIDRFENGDIKISKALLEINKLAINSISENEIQNYWRYTSQELFIKRLLDPPIINWEEIDDKRALHLLNEIIESIGDELVFARNSIALEKRFSKPRGTLSNWIFHEDISEVSILLDKLKKEDKIFL
ncbi:MAG: hypothetical protein AAF348_19725 [Bacteroidota bacterium]